MRWDLRPPQPRARRARGSFAKRPSGFSPAGSPGRTSSLDDVAGVSVDISGTGIALDAEWNGLFASGSVPASSVVLDLPRAEIHDISAFNALIPEHAAFALESGTGQIQARLEIKEHSATGTIDLAAKEIELEGHGAHISRGETFETGASTSQARPFSSTRPSTGPCPKRSRKDCWAFDNLAMTGDGFEALG